MSRTESSTDTQTPWWRIGMVWLVLSGPAVVVVAALATAVIAYHDADPVVSASPAAVAGKVGR